MAPTPLSQAREDTLLPSWSQFRPQGPEHHERSSLEPHTKEEATQEKERHKAQSTPRGSTAPERRRCLAVHRHPGEKAAGDRAGLAAAHR